MNDLQAQVDFYMELARQGNGDDAFHSLRELGRPALPELTRRFRQEPSADMRELLIRVIWESRDESVIPCLAEALQDREVGVRHVALDGLAALASPIVLDVLRQARTHRFANAKESQAHQEWIDEAIEQVLVKFSFF